MNFTMLFANPMFWMGLVRSAEVAVQKASPDYTVAHHIAAVVGGLLGDKPISTPSASAAEPVPQAIIDGVKGVLP